MVLTLIVSKTYSVTSYTTVEVPDSDVEAGLDFEDLIEHCDSELSAEPDGEVIEMSVMVQDSNGEILYDAER